MFFSFLLSSTFFFLFVFVLGLFSVRFIMFYKLIFVILLILLTEPAVGSIQLVNILFHAMV